MSIRHLNSSTTHLISSSVNISTVCGVVKELIENSIDAGASSIVVRLEKNGLTRIEIRDNGTGICKADVPLVGLANHTSKIVDYSDLDRLGSYGFRGQALNSLCAVADVRFTTRTKDDEFANTYTLDDNGRIVSSKPSPHCVGTTVVVENLFGRFPVRQKILSSKNSLRTTQRYLRCFGLAKPHLAITFSNDGSLIWRKSSSSSLFSAAQEVLGYKFAVQMHRMYWKGTQAPIEKFEEEEDLEVSQLCEPECLEMEVEMVVPQEGINIQEVSSFPSPEGYIPNVYLLVNNRPIKHKKIEQLMNLWICRGTLGELPKRKKPAWILKLDLPPDKIDVNLEADKTRILVHCENVLITRLEEILSEYYLISSHDPSVPTKRSTNPEPGKERETEVGKQYEDVSLLQSQEESDTSGKVTNSRKVPRDCSLSQEVPAKQRRLLEKEVTVMNDSGVNPLPSLVPTISELFNIDSFVKRSISNNQADKDDNIIEINIPPLPVNDAEKKCPDEGSCYLKESVVDMFADNGSDSPLLRIDEEKDVGGVAESALLTSETEGTGEMEIVDDAALGVVVNVQSAQVEAGSQFPDIDEWSRGNTNFGGTKILDPVKIFHPERRTSEMIDLNGNEAIPKPKHVLSVVNTNTEKPSSDCDKTHRTARDSLVMKSPLPNACSQLGRQDMRGFAEFSSKERLKIIENDPGMNAADVAKELARQWRAMSRMEQDVYIQSAQLAISKRQEKANEKPVSSTPDNQNQNLRQSVLTKSFIPCPRSPVVGMVMQASMEAVRNAVQRRREKECRREKRPKDNAIKLIGQLKPSGMWTYCKDNQIGIVRHFALQEVMVCAKLMATLTIPLEPLPKPLEISERNLGPVLWSNLLSLERNESQWVNCNLVKKNGFMIQITKDEKGDPCGLISYIASILPAYGINDLKYILSKVKDPGCKLSNCRPHMVVDYIKSEAVRMCRQSPPIMQKEELAELLKNWSSDGPPVCIHNQPILESLYETQLVEDTAFYSQHL